MKLCGREDILTNNYTCFEEYNIFYFAIFVFCISVVGSHGSRSPGNRYDARHEAWKCLNASNDYAQIHLDMFLYVNNIHIDIPNDGNNQEAIYRTIRLLYNLYDNEYNICEKIDPRISFGNRKYHVIFLLYLFVYLRESFRYIKERYRI